MTCTEFDTGKLRPYARRFVPVCSTTRLYNPPICAASNSASQGRTSFRNSIIAAFTGWIDSRNDPTKAVSYGDDTPVDTAALEKIAAFMQQERVVVPWQKGDILILDNNLTMHSRNTFEENSQRRVLASMWGPKLVGGWGLCGKAARWEKTNCMEHFPDRNSLPTVFAGIPCSFANNAGSWIVWRNLLPDAGARYEENIAR